MEYNKIVAITGLNGLYEMLNSKTDGAIVRPLDDSISKFVSSRVHNFSHLESIEVYTVKENVNLVDVFRAMDKSASPLPDIKDNGSIKKYFEEVFPDMDFERVYASDMKKMIKWFEILRGKVEFKLSENQDESTEHDEEPGDEAKAEGGLEETTPAQTKGKRK